MHERVIQRLFATSLALGVDGPLDAGERERCESEVRRRPSCARARATVREATEPTTTLEDLLARLVRSDPTIEVSLAAAAWYPRRARDDRAGDVNEAITNARKHADPRPDPPSPSGPTTTRS